MKITEEMVAYISTLSRLKPDEAETARMTAELEKIVSLLKEEPYQKGGNLFL